MRSPVFNPKPARPSALDDVAAERKRQFTLGYDAAHDDQHMSGEIAKAAACYALHDDRLFGIDRLQVPKQVWPYRWEFTPEATKRANLIKAAAMLLAEIDRLDRAALSTGGKDIATGGKS